MKRLLASVSLVAVTTTAALSAPEAKPSPKPAPVHSQKAPPVHIAPADEYFGKLKLSVLGIRNTIKDVGANLDIDQARWTTLASKVAFAEDAMHDWETKYPQDTWLAKTIFSLERMYAKLDSSDGRSHALVAMRWLIHDFPASWYGKTGKKELAMGRVGHPIDPTAAAPSPGPEAAQVAAPATVPSPAASPAAGTGGVGTVNPTNTMLQGDQLPAGPLPPLTSPAPAAGSPTPSPVPSVSPGTPSQN